MNPRLLAFCLLLFSVFPAQAAVLSLPTDLTGTVGQQITAPLTVDDATGILSIDLRIEYDSSVLSATAVNSTPLTSGANTLLTSNLSPPGVIRISFFSPSALSGSGALMNIKFNVVGNGASSPQIVECILGGEDSEGNEIEIPCGETQAGLDHFLFYKVIPTPGTPKFVPPLLPISLVDQIETREFVVKRLRSLGNPANKNNEDANAPSHPDHLIAYQIHALPPYVKRTNIRVDNQFGTLHVNTIKPDRLLVPSAKSLVGPVGSPVDPAVDHFKCYTVITTPGTPKFTPRILPIDDQFADTPRLFDIKKPTRLCTPVNKNDEEPGAEMHPGHLLCYQVKPPLEQPKHQKVKNIYVNNQFGALRLNTIQEEELCVPSVLIP